MRGWFRNISVGRNLGRRVDLASTVDGDSLQEPQAGLRSRASFELTEEDIETVRRQCRVKGDGELVKANSLPTFAEVDEEYLHFRELHPCVLEHFEEFRALLEGKRLAIFLDYDGTLTPIVNNPDMALMPEEMRSTVGQLAALFPTAIVSGRGRDKVEHFVQLKELYYAGSHGMDIAGPKISQDLEALSFQPAAKYLPLMDSLYQELTHMLQEVKGATVEHNKFCISAHFRNCEVDSWQLVVQAVEKLVAGHSELKVTRGRKVLEIRPQVDWDKGTALIHLLEALGLKSQPDVLSLYIGDDTTDEDAFAVLRKSGEGLGILVTTKSKPTQAIYTVQNPTEVGIFLSKLVEWGRTGSNGWHKKGGCNGWAPTYKDENMPYGATA